MILQDILVTQRKKFILNEVYKILEKHKFPGEVIDTIMDTQSVQYKDGRDGGSEVGDKDDQGNDNQGKDYPSTLNPTTYPSTLNPSTTYPTTTPHNNTTNNPINDFYALYNKKSLKKTYTFSSDTLNEILIIFNNLKVIPHGYEIMKSVLLKFINLRLESYSHLFDRRTETLYLFYSLFKNVVEVGFDNDPGCLKVFEKAFKENYKNLKPSLSSRLIEFSNNIVNLSEERDNDDNIDNLKPYKPMTYPNNQKYNQNNLITNYKEGALFRVFFHLFNLIEDKADFTERYSFELGRRLVKGITDLKKENHLIQIIKKTFGEKSFTCDAIRKSEIMLEDVIQKRNYDVNDRDINKARDKDNNPQFNNTYPPINNSFLLLTQCAWPFEYSPLNLRLPDDFIKITQLEEKRNKKKRLYWLWEYSTVLLEINQKEIRVNFLQFLILNLFNTQKSISKEEIIKFTKITGKTLEWVILSLIRSELIMEIFEEGGGYGNNKNNGHHNNTNQHENQVFYVLSSRPHKNNPYDYFIKENLLKDHEVNRIIYYQSLISRILKKNREIKSNELKGILIKNHTDRFDLDKEEVKKGLKGLIEKGVIEEEGGVLKYVP
ncbi:Cell division control protein 53 [Nosema bombycis CQ1]|uniref:Cell division control protein 53 n=1 Tax=Nosema bombycis (strain CQ1 / CVCC 102059) TaxID=578461 RepID=R0MME1_NOSB1|nr:Cell division control protein 53 [Nosema bombycis CQ1]|eukprot:EOB14018.1 Cell division control protein 53 [Nosema bombycis CQ1]